MSKAVVLDAGVLGMLIHPRETVNGPAGDWYRQCLLKGTALVVPEIADYELRRKLIHIGSIDGLRRLDAIGETLAYLPLTTEVMRAAAHLWAEMRQRGHPTATDQALDCDVILAAQARSLGDLYGEVIVATSNVRHLRQMVDARPWTEI